MNNLFLLIKLPFEITAKLLITILNIIPTPIYEIHGLRGNSASQRPDLREIYVQIKGKRTLHLGHAIIAYLNGQIFKAVIDTSGKKQIGIWTEDYEKIQSKWGL